MIRLAPVLVADMGRPGVLLAPEILSKDDSGARETETAPHLLDAYSPQCVEEVFSEVRVHDRA